MLAVSFERFHRSILIGMGIIPMEYLCENTAQRLGISGKERFTFDIPKEMKPRQKLWVKVRLSPFATPVPIEYLLRYVPDLSFCT